MPSTNNYHPSSRNKFRHGQMQKPFSAMWFWDVLRMFEMMQRRPGRAPALPPPRRATAVIATAPGAPLGNESKCHSERPYWSPCTIICPTNACWRTTGTQHPWGSRMWPTTHQYLLNNLPQILPQIISNPPHHHAHGFTKVYSKKLLRSSNDAHSSSPKCPKWPSTQLLILDRVASALSSSWRLRSHSDAGLVGMSEFKAWANYLAGVLGWQVHAKKCCFASLHCCFLSLSATSRSNGF